MISIHVASEEIQVTLETCVTVDTLLHGCTIRYDIPEKPARLDPVLQIIRSTRFMLPSGDVVGTFRSVNLRDILRDATCHEVPVDLSHLKPFDPSLNVHVITTYRRRVNKMSMGTCYCEYTDIRDLIDSFESSDVGVQMTVHSLP